MDPSIIAVRSPTYLTPEIISDGPGYTITPRARLDPREVSGQTRESIINRFARSCSQDGHSG